MDQLEVYGLAKNEPYRFHVQVSTQPKQFGLGQLGWRVTLFFFFNS